MNLDIGKNLGQLHVLKKGLKKESVRSVTSLKKGRFRLIHIFGHGIIIIPLTKMQHVIVTEKHLYIALYVTKRIGLQ